MSQSIPYNTLAYTKRLKQSGISNDHADAHAEALTEFVRDTVATSRDLNDVELRLTSAIEKSALRLIITLGSLIVAGVGVLATLDKLL